MDDLISKLKPVMQLYKAETAAIGFAAVSGIGIYLGWTEQTIAIAATVAGYILAYLRTRG